MNFNCLQLTLSVEFTLNVRLAVRGPNIRMSFCEVKKQQFWLKHREKSFGKLLKFVNFLCKNSKICVLS